MSRIRNIIITFINLLTLAAAISAVAVAISFYTRATSPCERFLRLPLLAVGTATAAISLVGLIGLCCRFSILIWLYLIALIAVILSLIGFTIFTILVTNKAIGRDVSGEEIGKFRLGDYSRWLQNYIADGENWERSKSCLIQMRLCGIIKRGKNEEFYMNQLHPIQVPESQRAASHQITVGWSSRTQQHGQCPKMVQLCLILTAKYGAICRQSFASTANLVNLK